MLPPKLVRSTPERRLLALFQQLAEADRSTLLDFAEFLAQRSAAQPAVAIEATQPKDIPRPQNESVIDAIRRLSETYPMLDKAEILHETSALMSSHVLQGRGAGEVIDELEALFRRHYERFAEQHQDLPP